MSTCVMRYSVHTNNGNSLLYSFADQHKFCGEYHSIPVLPGTAC